MKVVVIHWQWTEGPHKGATFWGTHAYPDGRIRDWPKEMNLRPLGASEVEVIDGQGLDLLAGHCGPPTDRP